VRRTALKPQSLAASASHNSETHHSQIAGRRSQTAANFWLLSAEGKVQHQRPWHPCRKAGSLSKKKGFLKGGCQKLWVQSRFADRRPQAAADHWLLAADCLPDRSVKASRSPEAAKINRHK